MPTIIQLLRGIFKPLWARIVLALFAIAFIAAGVFFVMTNKNKTALDCSDTSCQRTKDANSAGNEGPDNREPAAITEEGKKQEEEKKQATQTQPKTPANSGVSNPGGDTPAPSSTGGTTGNGETPPPSGTQGCPAFPAFPDANCTGVPVGVSLSSVSNFSSSANGQIISGLSISGDLVVSHDNVTVTNSRIKGRVVYNARGLTLRDVDLGADTCPSSSNGGNRLIAGDDYTLTRVHAHHNGADLIALAGGGNITIQDSLINGTCYYSGDHLDAIQYYDPGSVANVTLLHNYIDARPSNGGGFGNAAIFWADFPGAGSRLNVYNNFMAGGNYSLYALDAHAGSGVVIDVSGNRFLRNQYNYGPCALSNSIPFDGTSGIKWTNNAFSDGGVIAITDC